MSTHSITKLSTDRYLHGVEGGKKSRGGEEAELYMAKSPPPSPPR